MTKEKMLSSLKAMPIVASIKNDSELKLCLQQENRVVFVVFGTVSNIGEIVSQIKQGGKIAIVHLDLIDGLSASETAVDYIKMHTKADGIISTRPQIIRYAHEKKLVTVQRFFIFDTMALQKITEPKQQNHADFFEVLPGIIPKIIHEIHNLTNKPVIAGGLIREKEDVVNALASGAIAVSSTNAAVWPESVWRTGQQSGLLV